MADSQPNIYGAIKVYLYDRSETELGVAMNVEVTELGAKKNAGFLLERLRAEMAEGMKRVLGQPHLEEKWPPQSDMKQ